MSTELDQQYNKNVWEVGEKLTGKVMMRQVHLLTLFNASFRTSTMITDVLLLLLLLLLLILLDSCSFLLWSRVHSMNLGQS